MRPEARPKEKLRTCQRNWRGGTHMDLDKKGVIDFFYRLAAAPRIWDKYLNRLG